MPRLRIVATSTCVFVVASTLALVGVTRATDEGVRPLSSPQPFAHLAERLGRGTPPTTSQCRERLGRPCYGPRQFRKAYNLGPLYRAGYDGRGRTIAIVDSFGAPHIRGILRRFDAAFGLPAPPRFRVIQPAGPVPPYDPGNPVMRGWAMETALDVEYAHAMAPKANLLLVETPVAETLGRHGFPEIVRAENYVIDHRLAAVISQSFGSTEETFTSGRQIRHLRSAVKNARQRRVTMLAASGDAGATDAKSLGPGGFADQYFTQRAVSWPSSDPLVTSVGGTRLDLSGTGRRLSPDRVWNDTASTGHPAASGGGRSHVFGRPSYQNAVAARTRAQRGTPDVALAAADYGAAIVYLTDEVSGRGSGFFLFAGTSLASPLFAGVVAIATQYAGHRIGFLNPLLYRLAAHPVRNGLVDIRRGTNTVTFHQQGHTYTVRGFDARSGYDLSSGLGTIDAAVFVPALARASS